MAVFPLLRHPDSYRACTTDLLADAQAQQHWLHVYATHTDAQLDAAAQIGVPVAARHEARRQWLALLDELAADPARFGPLDILRLDYLRNGVLHPLGIRDEYQHLKTRENEAAIATLPERLQQLDVLDDDDCRLTELFRGILAGNLFDMGASATAKQYAAGSVPFPQTLDRVPKRPWRYDGVEAAAQQLRSGLINRAVIFADNAGADVVLGVLPLARELVRRSIDVTITANAEPAHNDITYPELEALLGRVAEFDEAFGSPLLRLINSGNDAPLIDLANISDELADASVDADLVVLVGMGRAIESNFHAKFVCPSWKVAMVKDEQVARSIDAELFDAVVKVEPGPGLAD